MREEGRLKTLARDRSFWPGDRVSWSAILAGVVLALVIQLMLSVLGVGIGAATVNPRTEENAMSGLGVGSAIWLLLSSIIAMFVGGCTAARLSGAWRRGDGILHGAVMWGVTTLAAIYFLTSAAGGLISGGAGLLGGIASTGGRVAAQSPQLTQEIQQELRERGINIEQIQKEVQNQQNQAQLEEKARSAGATLAKGISKAGILGFLAMAIGLAAAAWGGAVGVRRELAAESVPSERVA